MPRAGSSTLQEVLFHYRDRLAPQGLLYPVLSDAVAGTTDRSQVYNHKLLLQSAKAFWPPGRFGAVHDDIARQIAGSTAGTVLLSYEGWWDPAAIPSLARSTTRLAAGAGRLEPEIIAVVREPVSFLVSLYKLDVLHGRTQAVLADYWPSKLSDARLRYGTIAQSLTQRFARVRLVDFDDLTRSGRLVGQFLAEAGLDGILTRAGVPALERHRSKGGELFADSRVAMALHAVRSLGPRTYQSHRLAVLDAIARVAARPDLAASMAGLDIGLGADAVSAILRATAPECEALAAISGFRFARPEIPPASGARQTPIGAGSPLANALADALKPFA